MYTLLIAVGTSLILAYLVTELDTRVFQGDPFSLFVASAVILCVAFLLGFMWSKRSQRESKP